MKVFYDPRMSTPSGGYSPSGSKPQAAIEDWQAHGLDIEIVGFDPATREQLCLAHDPAFVDGVMSYRIANGHGNRSPIVAGSCLWTVGSLIAASRQALADGITCSPSSGFHHSTHDRASAFCTYNGLIVAARQVITEKLVKKVGIIDCDNHYGNGTQDIIDVLDLHDEIKHWTFGEHSWGKPFRQQKLLTDLGRVIRGMANGGAELILYQAGADPHINDPLGGLMETDELCERDAFVFRACRELGMAVCFVFAGGYMVEADGSIPKVLEIHRNTALEAIRVLKTQGRSTPTSTTTKKRIQMRDTTKKNLGKGIAIIGGVWAPKRDESDGLPGKESVD
jgi:acetoin utilization deacetylase AcuC-like enzyme